MVKGSNGGILGLEKIIVGKRALRMYLRNNWFRKVLDKYLVKESIGEILGLGKCWKNTFHFAATYEIHLTSMYLQSKNMYLNLFKFYENEN